MIAPAFIVALLCVYLVHNQVQAWTSESMLAVNTKSLFDITNDPYESTDLIDDASYGDSLAFMEDRRVYWNHKTIATNSPSAANKTSTWTTCKSVCPWLTSDYPTTTIERKYSYADAPHIIFVLLDDWGYNDFGARSTYLSWTTPTLDSLASEGIVLESYYTNEMCAPSRASLMTGRYSLRLGVHDSGNELPLDEITMAQELKSAGYRNYMVGKWHIGQSTSAHYPTNRGFDYFYGYVNGYESYWTKKYDNFLDLFENTTIVTDSTALDDTYHSAYLYQDKVEAILQDHSENYADTPMFLYYPMHLLHYPWTAPETYLERCMNSSTDFSDMYTQDDYVADAGFSLHDIIDNYCAMNVMMDEVVANLTCMLNTYGFSDNSILIISGDNGAQSSIKGGSYPFKGHKATAMRGAFANTAIIHSKLIPEGVRGTSYDYDVHITDWLPTFMNLATGGEWNGSYSGNDIDGVDIWDSIITNTPSTRNETVFISSKTTIFVGQYAGLKYIYHANTTSADEPFYYYTEDYSPSSSSMMCGNPSFIPISDVLTWTEYLMTPFGPLMATTINTSFALFAMISLFSVVSVLFMIMYHRQAIKDSKSLSSSSHHHVFSSEDHIDVEVRFEETNPLLAARRPI